MKTMNEKAFEYCKNEICATCCIEDSCYKNDNIGDCISTDMEYAAFIAGYKAALEWISVEEELPNKIINTVEDEVNGNTLYFYEHYIVKGYFKNKAKTESTWIGVYRPCSAVWYFQVVKPQNTVDFVITHWRPIN